MIAIKGTLAEELERIRSIRLQPQPTSPACAVKAKPRCDFCNDIGFVRVEREIGEPGFGRYVLCPKCNTPAERQKLLLASSNLKDKDIGASFKDYWTPSAGREKALEMAKLTMQRKGWLTLWGPYGNGKSYLGAAIVNECLRVGLSAKHYDMADLLDFLRKGFGERDGFERRFEEICFTECLVIDEANVFNATGWAYEKFRQIVQSRYRTSNKTVTVWILNPEPAIGNPELSEGLDFLCSRMHEFALVNVDDCDVRPGLAEEKGLL